MNRLISLLCLALITFAVSAVARDAGNNPDNMKAFEPWTYKGKEGGALPYRLFKPAQYDPKEKYPLILFLHGAGERGADNEAQLKWGGIILGKDAQESHPCFVVAPQCPPDRQWVNTPWSEGSYSTDKVKVSDELRMAVQALQEVSKEFSVDPARIYVMGLSMGGYGTWDAIVRYPDLFAAGLPICGAGDPSKAKDIKAAVWAFHGGADTVVPTQGSRDMEKALKDAGAKVKYSEYDGVGHGSWTNAWDEKELFEWMFEQKMPEK